VADSLEVELAKAKDEYEYEALEKSKTVVVNNSTSSN